MRTGFFRRLVVTLALLGGTPVWPQAPSGQEPLPSTLPLRREEAVATAMPSWLAATAAFALLALGATVFVGRQRRWTWLHPMKLRTSTGRELVRLSSQALTAQASLHTVRWHDEELLLACTGQQVTLLARRASRAPQGEAP
ncbi:flagellar biosynthetic protein FliO [Ramlibacter sp. XY19]|uniref:flagellar biosynthetic protein FliO n=1 Tax=Ramlibacter paludis TaxID=2908000 RepID=UPI0023DC3B69|nr:flagellar biosynthetic protein FliO [Ramlibacter paludis]MCG2594960.1 flagellar biosynthetic protein FliO [Ramlibacter paludis]